MDWASAATLGEAGGKDVPSELVVGSVCPMSTLHCVSTCSWLSLFLPYRGYWYLSSSWYLYWKSPQTKMFPFTVRPWLKDGSGLWSLVDLTTISTEGAAPTATWGLWVVFSSSLQKIQQGSWRNHCLQNQPFFTSDSACILALFTVALLLSSL